MQRVMLVAIGGMLGAVARYLATLWLYRVVDTSFPFGTLLVNVVGCFLIGALMFSALEGRLNVPPEARLFLVTGVLGGFTTFSSFGYETVALARDGQTAWAMMNVGANVVLGLAAVLAGRATMQALGL
jgi:CrcB protein